MSSATPHYRVFKQLVCLVGENPMPIYLSIQQFAADGAEVILVCSEKTKEVAKRLRDLFQSRQKNIQFPTNFEVLGKPYDPNYVRTFMEGLVNRYPSAALNYTGGTKVMSSFSVLPWSFRPVSGQLEEVKNVIMFYLEEEEGNFHFTDRATPIPLAADTELYIPALRQLHDIEAQKPGSRINITVEELNAIFTLQTTDPILLEHPGDGPINAEWINDLMESRQPLLSCLSPERRIAWEQQTVSEGASRNAYDRSELSKQIKFFRGDWLELLVEEILRRITPNWTLDLFKDTPDAALISENKIASGQNFKSQGQQFELDVIAIHNHRFFLFSMTTDKGKGLCQSKMFEAYYRARQVGGSLARSAVICLADADTEQKCFKSLGANPRNQIFGMATLQGWIDGDTEHLRRLKNFMERE
jgi:hypothetical protein